MSGGWDGPRLARPDEFGEAMAFTDRVFRPGQKGRRIVASQYPHAYQDRPQHMRRLLLLRHNGAIVGCLAIHPLRLRLGAAVVSAGGIGIVGTHPERRGEGIMTRLLQDAVARMEAAGHAISVLGGDRQRYGRFGWENAGVRNLFALTPRSLGPPSAAERGLRLEPFPAIADSALCRRIHRLGAGRPFAVRRRLADIHPLLQRNGRDAWTCRDGRRFAYAVLSGEARHNRPYAQVDEVGGDPDLVLSLLRLLMARFRRDHLVAIAGPDPEQVGLLAPVSAGWRRQSDGMVRIVCLERLVRQLRPELRRRARAGGADGVFRLQLAGAAAQACDLDLGNGARRHRVVLDPRQLVQLLFGCLPLDEVFAARSGAGLTAAALEPLSRVLPLPLHLPPLDHI